VLKRVSHHKLMCYNYKNRDKKGILYGNKYIYLHLQKNVKGIESMQILNIYHSFTFLQIEVQITYRIIFYLNK